MAMYDATNARWYGLLTWAGVFLLAITQIVDTDAWMHLNIGRTIWENGGIPSKESFVYTAQDLPFLYTSWLFSTIYYAFYLLFGYNGVILLKAIGLAFAFWILYLDALQRNAAPWLAAIIIIIFAIMCRGRFVERPDTLMFLFLAFSIYAVNAFAYRKSKIIYILPFVHLLWANIHSSVILLVAAYAAAIGGYGLYHLLEKKGFRVNHSLSVNQFKTLGLLLIISLSVAVINPNGLTQLFFGQSILNTDFFSQRITELQAPIWESSRLTFIITGIILFTVSLKVAVAFRYPAEKRLAILPSLVDIILLAPFVIAAFSTSRFVYPLVIVAAPIVISYISDVLKHIKTLSSPKVIPAVFFISNVLLVVFVSTTVFWKSFDRMQFGFGQSFQRVPESALRFMDDKGITGKVFNTFEWGGYIAWRNGDERQVFVDPRGHIPLEHLEDMYDAIYSPGRIEDLYETYGFQSILIKYTAPNKSKPSAAYNLAMRSKWALVYWDDQALLFVRRDGQYAQQANQYHYQYADPSLGFDHIQPHLLDPARQNMVVNELKRNVQQTDSVNGKLMLGLSYAYIGLLDKAEELLIPLLTVGSNSVTATSQRWLGYIFQKRGELAKALDAYKTALDQEYDSESMFNMGSIYYQLGKPGLAAKTYEKYLMYNPRSTVAYQRLIQIYNELGQASKAVAVQNKQREIMAENSARNEFNLAVAAYSKGNLDIAEEKFLSVVRKAPSSTNAYSYLGFVMFDKGDLEQSIFYHKKVLEMAPSHANSQYGLALAYMRSNDARNAIAYFRAYLDLAPTGHYAQRARTYIQELKH